MMPEERSPTWLNKALTAGIVGCGLGAILVQSRAPGWGRAFLAGVLGFLLVRLLGNALRALAGRLPWGRLVLPGLLFVEALAALAHLGPRSVIVKGVTATLLEGGLLVLAWRAWRSSAAGASLKAWDSLPERRLARRLEQFLGPRASRLVALELVVLGGLLQAAIGRGQASSGKGRFTYHRESFLGSFLLALPILAIGDLLLLDLILRHAAPWVRWTIHAVDLYGMLWILGLWQSMRARPHRVDGEALWLHRGVLGSLWIPRDRVAAMQALPVFDDSAERKAYLGDAANLAVSGGTEFLLEFVEPLRPLGLFGPGRARRRVVFTVDDPEAFREALQPLSR